MSEYFPDLFPNKHHFKGSKLRADITTKRDGDKILFPERYHLLTEEKS